MSRFDAPEWTELKKMATEKAQSNPFANYSCSYIDSVRGEVDTGEDMRVYYIINFCKDDQIYYVTYSWWEGDGVHIGGDRMSAINIPEPVIAWCLADAVEIAEETVYMDLMSRMLSSAMIRIRYLESHCNCDMGDV